MGFIALVLWSILIYGVGFMIGVDSGFEFKRKHR